jgi:hypothetical protein
LSTWGSCWPLKFQGRETLISSAELSLLLPLLLLLLVLLLLVLLLLPTPLLVLVLLLLFLLLLLLFLLLLLPLPSESSSSKLRGMLLASRLSPPTSSKGAARGRRGPPIQRPVVRVALWTSEARRASAFLL